MPNPLASAPRTRLAEAHDMSLERDRWRPFRPDGGDGAPDDAPESELGLADLLDIVNPLQHIPVIGNLYRVLTGDTISGPAQILGAALYGGPIGLIAGIVKAVASEINGANPGDALVARLIGADAPDETAVARAAPAPSADPAPTAGPDDGDPAAAATPAALTGRAALAALVGDLRTQGRAIEWQVAAPSLAVETRDGEAEPREDDRALAAALPEHAISARMLEGLDKYRALAIERGGAGRPGPARLDRSL